MAGKKTPPPEKRSKTGASPAAPPSADLVGWADRVVAALPAAKVAWRSRRPSFTIGGKIFAFTGSRGGTVMKLPEPRLCELVEAGEVTILKMGTRAMREWVVAPALHSERELELVREAFAYVASLPIEKK